MKFQEDFELREKVFRKMDWEQNSTPTHTSLWWEDEDLNRLDELPPIERSWEVCAEYLVPFMRGKGISYAIEDCEDGPVWNWVDNITGDILGIKCVFNDNIPSAACEAFLGVEL